MTTLTIDKSKLDSVIAALQALDVVTPVALTSAKPGDGQVIIDKNGVKFGVNTDGPVINNVQTGRVVINGVPDLTTKEVSGINLVNGLCRQTNAAGLAWDYFPDNTGYPWSPVSTVIVTGQPQNPLYQKMLANGLGLNSDQTRTWSRASLTNFAKTVKTFRIFDAFGDTSSLSSAAGRMQTWATAKAAASAGLFPIICFLNGSDINAVSPAFIGTAAQGFVDNALVGVGALDIWNEPTLELGASMSAAQVAQAQMDWLAHMTTLINAARKVTSDLLLVGPADGWASPQFWQTAGPIKDPNFVHSIHFYDPHNFTHQGRPSNGNPAAGSQHYASNKTAMAAAMNGYLNFLATNKVMGIVGETGVTVDAPSQAERVAYISDVFATAKAVPRLLWSDSWDSDAVPNAGWFGCLDGNANAHDILPEFKSAMIGA